MCMRTTQWRVRARTGPLGACNSAPRSLRSQAWSFPCCRFPKCRATRTVTIRIVAPNSLESRPLALRRPLSYLSYGTVGACRLATREICLQRRCGAYGNRTHGGPCKPYRLSKAAADHSRYLPLRATRDGARPAVTLLGHIVPVCGARGCRTLKTSLPTALAMLLLTNLDPHAESQISGGPRRRLRERWGTRTPKAFAAHHDSSTTLSSSDTVQTPHS